MSEHHGSCHCGCIALILRDTPPEASECNCSICRRIAGLWHYCATEAVSVSGKRAAYRQGDCILDLWHCQTCDCTTHWTATDPAHPRMGINLRMFDPALWADLPRKMFDGANY